MQMATNSAAAGDYVIDAKRDRLVITASSLGTVFEWYDFFIYGTLAVLIGKLFFPAQNETAAFLLALATFGAGFGVRPLGAVLFGYLGDRLGRKYTFLIPITLMGVATAGVARTSFVWGESVSIRVDLGGGGIIKKKTRQ